uniref:Large ribosomal subunit protein uL30m n=1 Tax=Scapholeberis mucronata TaxID=202097 RepID=A0A4Y7NL00_9CRUS|nr:EOG090X0EYV [Scapholeberis mucronata]SVE93921.1 EOG090X0EYV [Scapholeberis mucronata]
MSMHLRLVSARLNSTVNRVNDVVKSGSIGSRDPKLRNNQIRVNEDGSQVFHGFTYHPRYPGQQDPPYNPSKVLMVQRIRCLKKKPYWDKDTMKAFGFDTKRSHIAIIPNTPTNCTLLWKVKHLVRVTPITLPEKLPEDGDLSGARLLENGQLTFISKLKSDAKAIEDDSSLTKRPSVGNDILDGETLKKYLRLQWIKPW